MNNGTVHGFIPDGYTYNGHVSAEPRLHPALSFRYRPIMQLDRMKALIGESQNLITRENKIADLLSRHILEWDLKDPSGGVVERTSENMLRVHPTLYEKMYRIIALEMASDVPEKADVESHTVDITEQLGNSAAG